MKDETETEARAEADLAIEKHPASTLRRNHHRGQKVPQTRNQNRTASPKRTAIQHQNPSPQVPPGPGTTSRLFNDHNIIIYNLSKRGDSKSKDARSKSKSKGSRSASPASAMPVE